MCSVWYGVAARKKWVYRFLFCLLAVVSAEVCSIITSPGPAPPLPKLSHVDSSDPQSVLALMDNGAVA